ncbi:MAG: protein-export chaperone SecB [Pseudomonadales bacterium]|jgi:preprotein translocase subunit SecB
MSDQQQEGKNQQGGSQFALQRIFLKDASFESPGSPNSFKVAWKPKINLELNTRHSLIEEKLWEVVLHLTITVKNEQDENMYLVEVQQSGIFHLEGMDEETMKRTLGAFCPSVLFPYAREAVDALVVKGSYPALMLSPVNFDAIYDQSVLTQANNSIQ